MNESGIKGAVAGQKLRLKFDGIIKPDFTGKYGKPVINDIEYINNYSKKSAILLRIIKFIQKNLWRIGIAIHDPIFGECTPDFNCCVHTIGRFSFINISKKGTKNE